jgi:hypothetical protein
VRECLTRCGGAFAGQVIFFETQPLMQRICWRNSNFVPSSEGQKAVYFGLYKSTSLDPYFVTETSCSRVGSLSVDSCSGQIAKLADRKLLCAFKFGLTEIEVCVTNALGEKANYKLSFNI